MHYDHERMKALGFESFVNDPLCYNLVANYQARHLALTYDRRMLSWKPPIDPGLYPFRALQDLFPMTEDLMQLTAAETLRRVDIVGTTDVVYQTYRTILARMGWDGEADRRQINASPGSFHVNPRVVRTVRAMNDLDSELYAYAVHSQGVLRSDGSLRAECPSGIE